MNMTLPLPTLEDLRSHVLDVLCQHDQLDKDQTPLTEQIITKREKPCGLFFKVHGPRLLKTYAVWAGDEDRILFYNNAGERFAETQMSDSPDARKELAARLS
ncbi:MAG: hypothetical protein ACFCD0_30240 [Gemmataceae bacterium]